MDERELRELLEGIYDALRDIREGIRDVIERLEKLEPPAVGPPVKLILTPETPKPNQ